MPLCAGLLYWHLGQPSGIGAPKHTAPDASNITQADFEAMTAKLAQRMAANPDDPVGWLMLGRAYKALERYPDAVQALQEANRRKPNEPEILVEYAEALALQHGRSLDGEPMRLLERALKIDPNNPKALTLAGAAAFEAKDYKRAIAYWERLLGQVPADSELAQALQDGPRAGAPAGGSEARRRRGGCVDSPLAAETIRGEVRLAAALAGRAGAGGHGVRGCARGRRAAHAAGGGAQPGQGPAAALRPRRQPGDGAADEAVGFFQGDRDCTHIQERQCHAAERRPARRQRTGAAGRERCSHHHRFGGAMTAGLWMRRAGAAGLAAGLGLTAFAQTPPDEVRPLREPVEQFVTYMVQTHGFDRRELHALFAKVRPSQSVARAIAAPSTAKPWHEFRPLFVDEKRISAGIQFWNDNAETLARARETFGVPEGIIVALIGIETRYGQFTGGHKVAEALSMLAFDLDNRSSFFRSELEQFLLLAREQRWEPLGVTGSFAGAMGMPQFMPSSYRSYAVDFDGDGQIDLWRSTADAIGSVANYLRVFGWKDGDPVVTPARIESVDPAAAAGPGAAPIDDARSVAHARRRGHEPAQPRAERLRCFSSTWWAAPSSGSASTTSTRCCSTTAAATTSWRCTTWRRRSSASGSACAVERALARPSTR